MNTCNKEKHFQELPPIYQSKYYKQSNCDLFILSNLKLKGLEKNAIFGII